MRLEIKQRPKKRSGATRKVVALVIIIFAICIAALSLFGSRRSNMLREVAQSELESIAYDIIGRVAEEEISRDDVDYNDLVKIERDANGKISAITTDMQKLNLLKLRIANRLSEEMFNTTESVVKIPAGNLTGIDFLTGIGPDIKFRTMWVSSVDSDFENLFEAVGINQTRHQVMLKFSINVGMMFVGREIGVDVDMHVCVAETIIVGEIPNFFSGKQ